MYDEECRICRKFVGRVGFAPHFVGRQARRRKAQSYKKNKVLQKKVLIHAANAHFSNL